MSESPADQTINTLDLMRTGGERRAVIGHNITEMVEASLRLRTFFNAGWKPDLNAEQLEAVHQDFMMCSRLRMRADDLWIPLAADLLKAIEAQEAADQGVQSPS